MPLLASLLALVLLALSFHTLHANALVTHRAIQAHPHHAVARRRRDASSCIPRPSFAPPAPISTSSSSSSPSPSPTPTPTPTSSSAAPSSTNKWCYAWAIDNSHLLKFSSLSKVRYYYNWNSNVPTGDETYGLLTMPMLWGNTPQDISDFQEYVQPGYASIVLGFNEVNEPSQAYLSPAEAYELWMKYINNLDQHGYFRVSPSCTNDQDGIDWYKEFFTDYCTEENGCEVDALAFHGYSNDSQQIIDFATGLYDNFSKPIVITEFADMDYSGGHFVPDESHVENFARAMIDFVENTEWVMTACPFGFMTQSQLENTGVDTANALLFDDFSLTALGQLYFNST